MIEEQERARISSLETRRARARARWHARVADPVTRAAILARSRAARARRSGLTDEELAQRTALGQERLKIAEGLTGAERTRRLNLAAVQRYKARHRDKIREDRRRARRAARRNRQQALLNAVYAQISPSYPRNVRDDVAGEMLLALAGRKLRPADIASAAPKFIRAYWRANNQFTTLSLDAPATNDGRTFADFLVADAAEPFSGEDAR